MLDDLKLIGELDKGGMFDLIYKFPDHCLEAVNIAKDVTSKIQFENVLNIVITGMGGSAIGGDLVRMLAFKKSSIPIIVNRDYRMPSFVGNKTFVIASSYSGNTEETLAAYDEAKAKGAQIAVITTGGKLKEKADADNIPAIVVPAGLPPRAALGFSLFPILMLFQAMGVEIDGAANVEKPISLLKKIRDDYSPKTPEKNNPAKQLARKLFGKIPVIYGTANLTDVVAARWKGQMNENAKHPAFFNAFPELDHNEIMGYEGDMDLLKMLEIIILRSPNESERMKKRIRITADILKEKVAEVVEIWPQGDSFLEHTLSHIMLGDYASAYLAILNNKDPKEIDFIDKLKEQMGD